MDNTVVIREKQQFDDLSPQNPDGSYDWVYCGFTYIIEVNGLNYQVRTYDDEPGTAIVISPTHAHRLPETRALVEFLETTLGIPVIRLYRGEVGYYWRINPATLEFQL